MTEIIENSNHGRLIGYARVSTADQCLDLQVNALKVAGCNAIFEEHGVSAVAKSRPIFEQALAGLRPGDTLVLWRIDRAFRSLKDALHVLEQLEGRGIMFRSLTENIDTGNALGRFVYQLTGALAELERSVLSERTKAGIAAARKRGVKLGRPRALNEEQIAYARREHFEKGRTFTAIGSDLGVSRMSVSREVPVA